MAPSLRTMVRVYYIFVRSREGIIVNDVSVCVRVYVCVCVCVCVCLTVQMNIINPCASYHKVQTASTKQEKLKKTYLTVLCYSLLSLNMFQTVYPSSLISIGAYARGMSNSYLKMAVPTKNIAANQKEKQRIQILGRINGCHHCGSRQIIGKNKFIADHMPPTKQAKEMNNVLWRKWFGIQVKQALWPQCLSCWQLQGSAVSSNTHRLVFHHGLKLRHCSYMMACYLLEKKPIRKFLDDIENSILSETERLKDKYLE